MQRVGEYQIGALLGRGATASVYRAQRDSQPGITYAIKVFHPGLWDHAEHRRRAKAEFDTAARLNHPSIVRVVEALWENDPPAFVLEHVDGESLETFQSRLPYILPELSLLVMLPVLDALESAHQAGVFHRDLKPANILIGRDGRVAITDFGLAKITDVSRLTLSGTLVGSPDFMSPEQARGDVLSPASDVFSAAAVLYFLVTGTRPFSRGSPLATLAAVLEGRVEPPQNRNPKLSPRLAQIILGALAVKEEKRPRSASEFARILREYLDHVGFPSRSLADWVGTGSTFTLEALGTMASTLRGRCERSLTGADFENFGADLSHLGAVAPESDSVARLLAGADAARKRRQRKRQLVPAVLLLLVTLMGAGFWRVLRSNSAIVDQVAAPQAVVERAVSPLKPVALETPPATSVLEAPRAPALKRQTAKLPNPKRRTVTTSRVRIDLPSDVRMYWNGVRVDPERGLPAQSVGFHELKLEKDGMPPIVQRIQVKAGEPTVIRAR